MKNNFADLISALETSRKPKEDKGLTIDEIRERTGRGECWVYKALQRAMRAGKLIVGRRKSTRLDGRECTIPVYMVRA